MKRLTYPIVAAVLAGAIGGPALAGSLAEPVVEPVIAPAPAPVAAGADWTGGYVGAELGYGDVSAGTADGSGAVYGLRAGYDFDFGSWVLGAGIDYDWADIDLGGTDSLDRVARLKVRAGADLGRTLVYGTVGGARADANIGGLDLSDNGYLYGIGAEYALNDRWTVGGEVLNHEFDNFDGSGVDVRATTAAVNVGFRF